LPTKLRHLAAGVAIAATGALCGTGCGGGSDEEDVKASFDALRRAYLAQDYRGICRGLSVDAQLELGELGHSRPRVDSKGRPTQCPQDVATNMSAAILSPRDRVDPAIRDVDVNGEHATVVAVLGGTTPGVVRFVKEGGEWKLRQVYGSSAPPPPDLE
jgi:hypothetical protein